MYENIEQFYEENHDVLILDNSEGSLRPARSVPKEAAPSIEKFKEFRIQTDRMSFPHDELGAILGELGINTVTQNVRIMKEFGFITETSNANNLKEYNFTSSFVNFVNSSEDTRCYILDRLHAISSLADFTMYLNFLLCVLREAATEGHIIAYPDAEKTFRSKVVDAERRKSHRERIYNIYGFQSRGKHWDRDEYTPNISYYCQAELKELGLISKKHGERVDGMDTLTLTPSGHYLLKKISDNISNQHKKRNNGNPHDLHEPLNTILYGPPGTGKTYSTVDKVVSIISPNEYQEDNHKANKLIYDNLYKNKNVLFTTFHQSMSYEDFVEGIKPKIQDESDEEKEELTYEISSGIFKIACARAAYNSYKENKITNQKSYEFEDVYQAFIEMALSHISANDFINCKTITGKDVEIYKINKNDSIKARATGSIATHVAPLTKENIQKLYDTYNSIDEIKNLQQIKDTVGVSPRLTEFYAVFRSLLEFKQTTFQPIKDEEVIEKELNDDEIVRQFDAGLYTKSVKEFSKFSTPIVLVIDEINRGNVSAIFGELITLIEGDKRIGQANEIQLILPYSKVPFSVPPNLFILGTMNTADRSVEALDTALRRRFNFEEMMPDPSLLKTRGDGKGIVAEFKLWKILKTINERIEVLIDRDHTIGHAYLWDVKTITDLKLAFHNKIIPLLQEYFFGNYAKMELVIGAKFFNQKKKNKTIDFAVRNSELDIEPGTRYELLNIQEFSDGEMKTAISNLLVEKSKNDQ